MKYFWTIPITLIVAVLMFCFIKLIPSYRPNTAVYDYSNIPDYIDTGEVTEEIIEDNQAEEIVQHKTIREFAMNKLNDLIATDFWSHTNSNGCNFTCRVQGYTRGGKYSWLGENLYRGTCDEQNAYRLWKLSPKHNEVLQHYADEQVLVHAEYADNRCYYVLIKGILK
jgi:hypothetical protein